MIFEWHEAKRERNLVLHGLDFVAAIGIWRGVCVDPAETRTVAGEVRHKALGILSYQDGDGELVVAVVYTKRNGRHRIISARPASREERRDYRRAVGRAAT